MSDTTRHQQTGQPSEQLVEEARAFVGAPPLAAYPGQDPVNQPMINHWCQAFSDGNPAYVDAEAAARTRHGGIVAPPAMLGSWTLDGVARHDGGPRDQVLRRLEQAGYSAVVATQYEHTYHRELRPGDHLAEAISVESLSELKKTALGPGYFVMVRHDYHDQHGQLVGVARMLLLKFKPAATPETPSSAARPRPAVNADTRFFWDGVAAGELRIQRCTACGELRHPPRPMCGSCRSTAWDTVTASGRGSVYSYVVHHHPPLPGFAAPHVAALLELEEGVRLVSHPAAGVDGRAVDVGVPVQVVFEAVTDDLVLPLFEVLVRP